MSISTLEIILQTEIFDSEFQEGCHYDFYGDTEKIIEMIKENIPEEEDEFWSNHTLVEYTFDKTFCEKLGKLPNVVERYWAIWKEILLQIYNKYELSGADVEKAYDYFMSHSEFELSRKQTAENENDANTEVSDTYKKDIWKAMLKKSRPVILFYNFDEVAVTFPKSKKEGAFFYDELYSYSTKSNSKNKTKIAFISKRKCDEFSFTDKGSPLFAAYFGVECLDERR